MSYAQSGVVLRPLTMRWRDTKQLAILKALTAHLEGCIYANYDDTGEAATLAGRVYRGKSLFGEKEQTPFVSILEGKRPDAQPSAVGYDRLNRNEDWHLLVQGWIDDDPDRPLDNLYRLKGLVEERLALIVAVVPSTGNPVSGPAVYMCGGLISEMSIGPGIVRPLKPEVGGTEAFYLPVVVTFAMDCADPFAVTAS